ncbi:MAG: hypothetical protein OXN79_04260 [bacterium]|nr:hypothetical protein [bacterium]
MSNINSPESEELPMREVRVFFNSEEGADWWCEDDGDFMAVADTPAQLLELIRKWQTSEGVADVQLVPMGLASDVVAEEVFVGLAVDD